MFKNLKKCHNFFISEPILNIETSKCATWRALSIHVSEILVRQILSRWDGLFRNRKKNLIRRRRGKTKTDLNSPWRVEQIHNLNFFSNFKNKKVMRENYNCHFQARSMKRSLGDFLYKTVKNIDFFIYGAISKKKGKCSSQRDLSKYSKKNVFWKWHHTEKSKLLRFTFHIKCHLMKVVDPWNARIFCLNHF